MNNVFRKIFPIYNKCSNESKIIQFYIHNGHDNKGRTLEELLKKNISFLEDCHDYIQWLFPLNERSLYNFGAPILSPEDIRILQTSDTAKNNMLRALQIMLAFYGLELNDMEDKPTITLVSNGLENSFTERSKNWLTKSNHNYLRLTRILKSLRLFELEEYAIALYQCLEAICHNNTKIISEETFKYWTDAFS